MDLTTFMGTIGALTVLTSFILNQIGKWEAKSFYYDLTNFVGSAILFIYAMYIRSYPFVVLFLVWAAFSLRDVIQGVKK